MSKKQKSKKPRVPTESFTKTFRYVGNIAHIHAYIRKNSKLLDPQGNVMVELYIRPMSKLERETYGDPKSYSNGVSVGHSKVQRRVGTNTHSRHGANGSTVEKKSGPITRAHLRQWKLNFQEPAA